MGRVGRTRGDTEPCVWPQGLFPPCFAVLEKSPPAFGYSVVVGTPIFRAVIEVPCPLHDGICLGHFLSEDPPVPTVRVTGNEPTL